jgi:hypothetical protein
MTLLVIPAKAGIPGHEVIMGSLIRRLISAGIPAFAGMTV